MALKIQEWNPIVGDYRIQHYHGTPDGRLVEGHNPNLPVGLQNNYNIDPITGENYYYIPSNSRETLESNRYTQGSPYYVHNGGDRLGRLASVLNAQYEQGVNPQNIANNPPPQDPIGDLIRQKEAQNPYQPPTYLPPIQQYAPQGQDAVDRLMNQSRRIQEMFSPYPTNQPSALGRQSVYPQAPNSVAAPMMQTNNSSTGYPQNLSYSTTALARDRGLFDRVRDRLGNLFGGGNNTNTGMSGVNPNDLAQLHNLTNNQFAGVAPDKISGFMRYAQANGLNINSFTPEQANAAMNSYLNMQMAQDQFAPTALDWSRFALSGVGQAWGMYNNYKQTRMAEDNYNEMRALNHANFRNQADAVNTNRRDAISGRGNAVMSQARKSALGRQAQRDRLANTY